MPLARYPDPLKAKVVAVFLVELVLGKVQGVAFQEEAFLVKTKLLLTVTKRHLLNTCM